MGRRYVVALTAAAAVMEANLGTESALEAFFDVGFLGGAGVLACGTGFAFALGLGCGLLQLTGVVLDLAHGEFALDDIRSELFDLGAFTDGHQGAGMAGGHAAVGELFQDVLG